MRDHVTEWVKTTTFCAAVIAATIWIQVCAHTSSALVYIGPRWVLWCVDDDGRTVPIQPELVRRGRIVALEWGRMP